VGALATALGLPVIAVVALVAGLIAAAVAIVMHWSTIKQFFSDLGAQISQNWTQVTTSISNAWSNAVTGIGNKINQLKASASNAWNDIKAKAQNAVNGMAQAFQNGVGRVRSAMTNIKNSITNTLSEAASAARAAATRIVTAIADGIRAGIGAVSSAASAVAAAVSSKLPGSPVAEGSLTVLNHGYAGKKISEMLALGIEGGVPMVNSAANAVTAPIGAAVGTGGVNPVAMAASASGSSGGSVSLTYSPTITIGAGVSSAQKQDFMALLRSHKDEIAAMLGQQSGRNDWLSYS
jgi:phage-related protein